VIVYKVEPGMDRREILATTYQMRNFYRQFGDGFFSALDVMNYIQHHQIVKWCRDGTRVLDVCCGRGLLLPMLRYQRKALGGYTGVDIKPGNATWTSRRVTDGKPVDDDYYPFPTRFVESNAAEMAAALGPARFDFIVYTSAIEHMQREAGEESLRQCRAVAAPGAMIVLTCPNTPEDKDGFDTQYAAHVYEWKRSELLAGLAGAGFELVMEWGIMIDWKSLEGEAEKLGLLPAVERIAAVIPREWLLPVFAPLFPAASKEIAMMARAV
jgi:SAM-dependent methyltransferase